MTDAIWLALHFCVGLVLGAWIYWCAHAAERRRYREELEIWAREVDALRVDSAKLWTLGLELKREHLAWQAFDDEVRH